MHDGSRRVSLAVVNPRVSLDVIDEGLLPFDERECRAHDLPLLSVVTVQREMKTNGATCQLKGLHERPSPVFELKVHKLEVEGGQRFAVVSVGVKSQDGSP